MSFLKINDKRTAIFIYIATYIVVMATTISVSHELLAKLKERKLYDKESYEEVIWDALEDSMELSEETKKMLNNSIDAFINEDTSKAKEVCGRDSVVDDLRDRILRNSIDNMIDDPSTIERNMHLIRITKNLERIADLSTNVCEDVIYVVEGKVIKHHLEERKAD